MATQNEIRTNGETRGTAPLPRSGAADPPLGDLFKQLAQDSTTLIKQEMALARTEMQQAVRSLARGAVMLAIGGAVLLVAGLALTAFLIVGLGSLLANYWLSALIVGVVYAAIGGVLLMRGKDNLSSEEMKPEETMRSLQQDKRWVQSEVAQVKRDLTS